MGCVCGPAGRRAQGVTIPVACNSPALIAAIDTANAASGADTLDLAVGCAYTLTVTNNFWYGPTALPLITSDITIEGNGATISRNGAGPAFRLMVVSGAWAGQPAGALSLRNLSLTNGFAQGGGSVTGGGGAGMGGAIFNQGDLSLSGVTVRNNQAIGGNTNVGGLSSGGGGIGTNAISSNGSGFGPGAFGGSVGGTGSATGGGGGGGAGFGPSSDGGAGTAVAAGLGGGASGWGFGNGDAGDGAFRAGTNPGGNGGNFGSGGTASATGPSGSGGGGGGIGGGGGAGFIGGGGGFGGGGGAGPTGGGGGFGGGSATLDRPGYGGGISNGVAGGAGAGMGGAIFNLAGQLTIVNSTLIHNTARGGVLIGAGAPLFTRGSGLGGAIFNLQGNVTILQSTLAFNVVTNSNTAVGPDGGAVYNLGYLASTNGGTFAPVATLSIVNSILSNSTTGTGAVADVATAQPFTVANGTSNAATAVVSADSHNLVMGVSGYNNLALTSDPQLAPAANNGGPTLTMAIACPSAAVNAGDPAAVGLPATDQRGSGFPRVRGGAPDLGAYESGADEDIFVHGFESGACAP